MNGAGRQLWAEEPPLEPPERRPGKEDEQETTLQVEVGRGEDDT